VDTIAQSSSEKKAGKAVGSFRNLSENHNTAKGSAAFSQSLASCNIGCVSEGHSIASVSELLPPSPLLPPISFMFLIRPLSMDTLAL